MLLQIALSFRSFGFDPQHRAAGVNKDISSAIRFRVVFTSGILHTQCVVCMLIEMQITVTELMCDWSSLDTNSR